MADERWQRQWEIFHGAIELPAAARPGFVASRSVGDPELEAAVLELLAAHERPNPILEAPVFGDTGYVDPLDPESLVGESIDGYAVRSIVGQGGMGVVYEAEQQPLGRRVALKLIRVGMDTRQVVGRFETERRALAMMNHPNIAQVLDAGATASGRPYFVMEFIDGPTITDYCDAHRLTTSQRLELFLQICAGVQHAHQKSIIHRDLKPTNVLVAVEDGRPVPKIIDFGIAKAIGQTATGQALFTQAGVWVGTPEYMSPEQASVPGREVDTRTDVYSLGILLYELLVGALPFEGEALRKAGYEEICRRIREDEPARPSVRLSTLGGRVGDLARLRRTTSPSLLRALRGDLDWVTMRALAKDPERRYPSASELATDLRRHLNDEPVEAGPPSAAYLMRKFAKRHALAVTAGVVVMAALVLGVGAATFGLLRAQEAERRAHEEARTSEEVSDFLSGLFRVSEPSAVDVNSITAREVLDRGVERIRGDLAAEPAIQSRLMHEMGRVYAQLGLLEEAERLHQEALQLRRRTSGATGLDVAEVLASLAGVHHLAGRHEEAIRLYEEAIRLAAASDDEGDAVWLATVYRSQGGVYDTLGRTGEALEALDRARRLLEASGNAGSAEYGRTLRNIGMAHWSAGDFEAARNAYEASLDVYEGALPPGHPELSYVVNSLAILNYNLGDLEAARPMFERELANLERTLGPEHRNTASVMNNLGLLLLEMGLIDEARPRIEESLRIREAVLGDEHEEVATSLSNLARLQLAEGDPQAARRSLERCIAIRERVLGPAHPYVASALDIYAQALRRLGDEGGALGAERRARGIREPAG